MRCRRIRPLARRLIEQALRPLARSSVRRSRRRSLRRGRVAPSRRASSVGAADVGRVPHRTGPPRRRDRRPRSDGGRASLRRSRRATPDDCAAPIRSHRRRAPGLRRSAATTRLGVGNRALRPTPTTRTATPHRRERADSRRPAGSSDRTPRRMGNLPTPLSSFVGRTDEIREICELLSTTRLVSLLSFGGVGKTRLAIEVAAQPHGSVRRRRLVRRPGPDHRRRSCWPIRSSPESDCPPRSTVTLMTTSVAVGDAGTR